MERKKAWITAGVVAVTFTTSTLAVMANTGLLAISPSARNVGRLTSAGMTLDAIQPSTTTTAERAQSVRYEDVYVPLPALDGATAPGDASQAMALLPKPAGPVPSSRTTPSKVPRELGENHEGANDDD